MLKQARAAFLMAAVLAAREEGILSVVRPRTILIRAMNDNNVTYSYDITIEKATD